jgi:N-acetylneuraminic acid mutarotase
VFQNQKAVIYGGHVLNGFEAPVDYFPNEIWTFNRPSNSMTLTTITGTAPSERTFHGAVAISDSKMMIWGGGTIQGFSFAVLSDMWIYDTTTSTWTQKNQGIFHPSARLGHAMARKGNQVFVFGGIIPTPEGECCDFLNDMYAYSISGNQWTQLLFPSGVVPSARAHAGIVTLGNFLYLQGGEGTFFNIENGLWKYNTNQNSWSVANQDNPDVNQREGQLFGSMGANLVCFSGDGEGPNFYNLKTDTQTYNVGQGGSWALQSTPVQPPAGKRMPSVSFTSPDEVWFFGGNTDLDPFTFIEANHNQVWYWKQ